MTKEKTELTEARDLIRDLVGDWPSDLPDSPAIMAAREYIKWLPPADDGHDQIMATLAQLQETFPNVRFTCIVPRRCPECGQRIKNEWECYACGVEEVQYKSFVTAKQAAYKGEAEIMIHDLTPQQADEYFLGWRELPPIEMD